MGITTDMMEEPDSLASKPPTLKIGDRMWVWLASAPASFELMLADRLSNFPPEDSRRIENGVYYVSIHSWRGNRSITNTVVNDYFPHSYELPKPCLVSFMHVDGEHEFEIPDVSVAYSSEGLVADVRVAPKKLCVHNQIVLLVAVRQEDYDAEAPSLAGISDAIGLLSILSGHMLYSREIIGGYFCRIRCKFISGRLKAAAESTISTTALRFAEPRISFDATDERTHGALWFAGRAFSAEDHASKIVFYRTALELIGGKCFRNFFGAKYKTHASTKTLADSKLEAIEKLRADVVHCGKRAILQVELERYVQALIVDGLRFKHNVPSPVFAIEALYEIEQSENAEMNGARSG
jgi:hypothetical protein